MGQPINPPTRGGSNWIAKFLAYQKVSRVELAFF